MKPQRKQFRYTHGHNGKQKKSVTNILTRLDRMGETGWTANRNGKSVYQEANGKRAVIFMDYRGLFIFQCYVRGELTINMASPSFINAYRFFIEQLFDD